MGYPLKSTIDFFGREQYVEMTPDEYLEQLAFYREKKEELKNSMSRRHREYQSYLERWFGDGKCDGFCDYETRVMLHQLPMSENVYLFG